MSDRCSLNLGAHCLPSHNSLLESSLWIQRDNRNWSNTLPEPCCRTFQSNGSAKNHRRRINSHSTLQIDGLHSDILQAVATPPVVSSEGALFTTTLRLSCIRLAATCKTCWCWIKASAARPSRSNSMFASTYFMTWCNCGPRTSAARSSGGVWVCKAQLSISSDFTFMHILGGSTGNSRFPWTCTKTMIEERNWAFRAPAAADLKSSWEMQVWDSRWCWSAQL